MKAVDSDSSYSKDIEKFQNIVNILKEKYNLSSYDLIDILLKKKIEKPMDMIPVSIFKNDSLSALESIVKYMKENLNISSKKTAELLNRNISTISSTYIKASKKHPAEFLSSESKQFIPIKTIAERKYSVLEALVRFMKTNLKLANKEIANLLNRDARTIWTVNSRAKKKEGLE